MMIEGPLHISSSDGEVVLTSSNPSPLFGALFFAVSAIFVGAAVHMDSPAIVVGMCLIFSVVGIFFMLPRRITTTFDLKQMRVQLQVDFCSGLYARHDDYTFNDIRGVGLREFYNEGYSYLPVLTLSDGKRRWLATMNGSALTSGPILDRVCKLTGLTRVDHKGTWWGG